jgi:uncharacterized repeat protein (TIGR03803 family)
VTALQPVGRLPAAARLDLSIGLPLRNQEVLSRLLEELYNPASPQYRHYLTPEQFAERFGPTTVDYEAVIAFAKAHSLSVTGTHPNRTLLDVSGSVSDIEQALHVHLQVYQHPTENRTFHAPDVEPSLDLAVHVLHISGLSDLSRPRSRHQGMASGLTGLRPAAGGSSPGGGFMGDDFRNAYVPGVSLTGAGQSVALVEFDGYFPSDIADYETLTGRTSVPLQNVLLDGADGSAGSENSEVALDIEMAISMAPGLSQVIVYEAPNNLAYVNDILNRIATDNLARQISCSWFSYADFGDRTNTEQVFQQYAAQGQSFFEISGDFDAYPSSYLSASGTPNGFPNPCDSPYVTIVGGTELSMTGPGGDWLSESVWNMGYFPGEGYSVGSSGGISPTYASPSWQQGIDMTANHGSANRRNIPDVAMVADNIWVLALNGLSYASYGTSASAPLWAGFAALANELAATKGQPAIGFINPTIYALGRGSSYHSTFHDITVGNNNSSSSQTGFPAVPGYDLCTGWGTPSGSNLLYALVFPEFLHIAPETSFTAAGKVGGPFYGPHFLGPTQTYELTNAGGVSLDWSLGHSVPWLDASLTGGTLAPSAPPTSLTLNLNSAADSLPIGDYTATIWFTNLNDGSVQTRVYTLSVQASPQTVPIIVAQSTNVTVLEGQTATYTVQVTPGSLPVTYTWIRNGIVLQDGGNISGATTSTLTISNVSADEVGVFEVAVANSLGLVTGYAVVLTLASPPVIVTDATNQMVLPGDSATFAVGAVGTKPFSYQWQSNGTNIIGAANTNVLTLPNVSRASAGVYSVLVSNLLGWVTNAGATLSIVPVTVQDTGFASLYSFTGGSDGANPNGLVMATNGLLYGSAISGGSSNVGTLFRITTNGVLTTLHTFSGRDGGTPRAGLIQARDGFFYGTTSSGGQNSAGTVFRMFFNGGFVTLHTFGFNDGASSLARLAQGTDGNLYGTTSSGGGNGSGTVFRMTPNGGLTSLHSFSGGADGSIPWAGVIQGNDGNFFGVVKNGGISPYNGKAFKVSPTGAFTVLAEFGGTNGLSPRGSLVQARDGNFYGTTYHGGALGRGTVFRLTPAGLLTTIHSFNGEGDGFWPMATLVEGQDGYLYGATSFGGKGFNGSEFSGQGTLFRIFPKGQFTTLVYFDGFNGANPNAPLAQAPDGSFYGTTLNGGANGAGTVFRLTVPVLAMTITTSAGGLVLSWPSWASDLVLQETSDLSSGSWLPVTNSPVVIDSQNQVIVSPAKVGNTFFRLMH